MGQRGMALVDLLTATLAASVVIAALVTIYLGASRGLVEATDRAALQRQGSLAVDEIGRRARAATSIVQGCAGQASAIALEGPDGPICFYAGPAGELCEDRGRGCRDLLRGALQGAMSGLQRIALFTQPPPGPPDPVCPDHALVGGRCPVCPDQVAPGSRCFLVEVGQRRARVAFAISDGLHAMAFDVSHTCAGRNC